MKIKLQDYSLISNEWINSEIERLVEKRDSYPPDSPEFAFCDGEICIIVKIKAVLIPSEKLAQKSYDAGFEFGYGDTMINEEDFLTSEIELL